MTQTAVGGLFSRMRLRAVLSTPGVQALLLLLIPTMFFIATRPFFANTDPDYWWHVRTGQYIYETGALPRSDAYSYTRSGAPWVTHEWLTELLLYVVTRWGGYVAAAAFFGVITGLTWLIVYLTCRRQGMGQVGATVLMLWGFVMSLISLNVRPQGMTTLFLALCVLILTLYRQGVQKPLYLLPPLFAIWVNMHGGYAIGLAVIALAVAGQIVETWSGRSTAALRPLLLAAVFAAAATLLNPHGLAALTYPFSYAGAGNASMLYIEEWQSPNFHLSYYLVFAASLVTAMVLGLKQRPLGMVEVLWVVVFSFLALRSIRHLALYAVVVMPLIGARLGLELPIFRRTLQEWRNKGILALIWPAMIIGALALVANPDRPLKLQFGAEPTSTTYPEGAVQYLREHEITGNLFNEYVWGGYLIYQLYPEYRVFIDGRADVYGDAFVDTFAQVASLRPTWRKVLDDYDVDVILVREQSVLAVALMDRQDWQDVYTDNIARLFVRKQQ
jgi:hypothetical protein